MNNVTLLGRLTKDPEIRTGNDDFIVATYTLAVDRPYLNKDGERDADFIRCQAFGRSAEFAETYLSKGMMIGIRGSIRTGSYENKDGDIVYTTDVIVENHYFTGSGSGSIEDRRRDDGNRGARKRGRK